MQSEVILISAGVLVIGIGATAVMDVWAVVQKSCFGVLSLDYRLVGRWIGHFPKGRFIHDGIAKADPVPGERLLGWGAHYAIGVIFAAILISTWGVEWILHPTLLPALIVGIGSIAAPLFILQPALGFGIAASRTPRPWLARARSLVTHTSYAVGLYVSALAYSGLIVASL